VDDRIGGASRMTAPVVRDTNARLIVSNRSFETLISQELAQ